MKEEFNRLLLVWYATNARELPWRGHVDAYGVWVSEIMLQQTRVETVIPYFERWIRSLPDVKKLAQASEQEVLFLWEGLGYYSRVRSIHKAAKMIVDQYGGIIPQKASELVRLPGIGRYTAAAISSIAFSENVAVLDGNVKRVYARVTLFPEEINNPPSEKLLWRLAEEILPSHSAGDYNQALMDLGATICTPKTPDCEHCPVKTLCQAYQTGLQEKYPVIREKSPIPHITVCAAIISRNTSVLIAKRPPKGLLGGLWEFPGGKIEPGESQQEALMREIREELAADIKPLDHFGEYRHAYTHFRVTLHAWKAELTRGNPIPLEASEIRWVEIAELTNYPMGKIDRSISNDLVRTN